MLNYTYIYCYAGSLMVSQARWRDGNNFRGGATNRNLSPRGLRTAVATTTSRPPSSRTEVSAPEGARQIQQGPQPKELPRLPRQEG